MKILGEDFKYARSIRQARYVIEKGRPPGLTAAEASARSKKGWITRKMKGGMKHILDMDGQGEKRGRTGVVQEIGRGKAVAYEMMDGQQVPGTSKSGAPDALKSAMGKKAGVNTSVSTKKVPAAKAPAKKAVAAGPVRTSAPPTKRKPAAPRAGTKVDVTTPKVPSKAPAKKAVATSPAKLNLKSGQQRKLMVGGVKWIVGKEDSNKHWAISENGHDFTWYKEDGTVGQWKGGQFIDYGSNIYTDDQFMKIVEAASKSTPPKQKQKAAPAAPPKKRASRTTVPSPTKGKEPDLSNAEEIKGATPSGYKMMVEGGAKGQSWITDDKGKVLGYLEADPSGYILMSTDNKRVASGKTIRQMIGNMEGGGSSQPKAPAKRRATPVSRAVAQEIKGKSLDDLLNMLENEAKRASKIPGGSAERKALRKRMEELATAAAKHPENDEPTPPYIVPSWI